MKKEVFLVLSTGFALFSMFFGSGNLVFPIQVGMESEGHYMLASLGVLCTCVIFPLLGMLGMTLYQGSIERFFECFGKNGVFLFSLIALGLMGPFGVLARCLTVIHGTLLLAFPTASLAGVNFGMCILIYFLTVNKNRIVTLLGSVLTPFLLVSIGAIAFFGLSQGALLEGNAHAGLEVFKNGFLTGYQTMDLVAAFFFSGFVIQHLESTHKSPLTLFLKASLVAALLLYAVYFVLVLLGWQYAPLLVDVQPQEMLGQIALKSLGTYAAPSVCLAVIFACLTTAIALTSLFAEFLKTKVAQDKIGNKTSLIITLAIAFFVSNLNFAGIAQFLGPILEAMYPALILLTLVNIGRKGVQYYKTKEVL